MANQTRITIDRFKVAAFRSEETLCFEARVLFDGKPIAMASNDGHGGYTDIRALDRSADAALEEAEAFAKSLPAEVTDWPDPNDKSRALIIPQDLNHVVDDLACKAEDERRIRTKFQRDLKNRVIFVKDGAVYETKPLTPAQRPQLGLLAEKVRAKHPTATILNSLTDQARAFALYFANVQKV